MKWKTETAERIEREVKMVGRYAGPPPDGEATVALLKRGTYINLGVRLDSTYCNVSLDLEAAAELGRHLLALSGDTRP